MTLSFLHPVASDLVTLEDQILSYLLTPDEATNRILAQIFASGGKRIRPAVFFLVAKLIGYEGEHKFPIASVCEYIHTASLLHDDVIDNSTLRRNKPTVNSIWGDQTAVLAGDLIYSSACRLMVTTGSLPLIEGFTECIRRMSESELLQLDMLWKKGLDEKGYLRIVDGKTSILFENSAKSPCHLIPDLDPRIAPLLGTYGAEVGRAFQIFDDCLDYKGSEDIVGKPVVSDILKGKITLPLILALKSPYGAEIHSLIEKVALTGQMSGEEKPELLRLVHESGALKKSVSIAAKHADIALESLKTAASFLNLSSEALDALATLEQIPRFVTDRTH